MLAFAGPETLMIVAIVALVVFGGSKIPELARSLGKAKGEFQKGLSENEQAKAAAAAEAQGTAQAESPATPAPAPAPVAGAPAAPSAPVTPAAPAVPAVPAPAPQPAASEPDGSA
jgi:TatA/E family protein of Tat protein translocase